MFNIDTNSIQVHIHSHVLSLIASALISCTFMTWGLKIAFPSESAESASAFLTSPFRKTLEYGTHFLWTDSFHMTTKDFWWFGRFATFKTSATTDAALLMGVLREMDLGEKLYCNDWMQSIQVNINSMAISFGCDLHWAFSLIPRSTGIFPRRDMA